MNIKRFNKKIKNDNAEFNNFIKSITDIENINCPVTIPYQIEFNKNKIIFKKQNPFEINAAISGTVISILKKTDFTIIEIKTENKLIIEYKLCRLGPYIQINSQIIINQYIGDAINTAEITIKEIKNES